MVIFTLNYFINFAVIVKDIINVNTWVYYIHMHKQKYMNVDRLFLEENNCLWENIFKQPWVLFWANTLSEFSYKLLPCSFTYITFYFFKNKFASFQKALLTSEEKMYW
jgi:hypothetical protein